MFTISPEVVSSLESRGAGKGIRYLVAHQQGAQLAPGHVLADLLARKTSIHADVYLSDELLMFDHALETLSTSPVAANSWCQEALSKAWSSNDNEARGVLSELEAIGTVLERFPLCILVPRDNNKQTPDFLVPGEFSLEVYRPRESQININRVAETLENQSGPVKLALSYPLTGSEGRSLEFPASKIVDRLLNAKRSSEQVRVNISGILYIDVRHDWSLDAKDLLPFRTVFSKGEHWIGTFGVWHAFYGEEHRATMLRDRKSLPFLAATDVHEQKRTGLFRTAPHWSAVILALRDGIAIFENPWASNPICESTMRELLRLYRARPEFSWYRGGASPGDLAKSAEMMLSRLEWTFVPLR